MKPITLDEFIEQLKTARKDVGGKAKVMVCTPYEQGVGWRYEYVINAHAYGGNVDIPITLEQENDDERQAKQAAKFKRLGLADPS